MDGRSQRRTGPRSGICIRVRACRFGRSRSIWVLRGLPSLGRWPRMGHRGMCWPQARHVSTGLSPACGSCWRSSRSLPASVLAERVGWGGSRSWFRIRVVSGVQYAPVDPADRLECRPGDQAQCDRGSRWSRSHWVQGSSVHFCGTLATRIVQLKPFDPDSKGIVERANQYLETSFLPGRSFTGPDHFNTQLAVWLFNTQLAVWLPLANSRTVRRTATRSDQPVVGDPPCPRCHR